MTVAAGEDKALSPEELKTAELADITPPSEPIFLAREMVADAPDCIAAVSILVREDGTMIYKSCGHQRKDVLWALQKMIFELMSDGDLGD